MNTVEFGQFWKLQSGNLCFCVPYQSTTVIPMLRAVPSTVRIAALRSFTLRSGSFIVAISLAWVRVRVPTILFAGSPDPFSSPIALLIRIDAGGVLVIKEKERSAYTVTTTGIRSPCWAWVRALNALQNSIILTPR